MSDHERTALLIDFGGVLTTSVHDAFRAFARDTPSSSRAGLGLGLFIVQQIVTAHGGTVVATSGDGRVHFTVCVPRRCPS